MSQAEISKVSDSKIEELLSSVKKISVGDGLQCQLEALQCPFTWKMKELLVRRSPVNVTTRLEKKEEECDGEEGAFPLLLRCGLQLALCFENSCEGDFTAARERQRICDELIENEDVPYLDGLKHISRSCAVHLAHLSGMVSYTRALLNSVIPFDELNDENKACVHGMRGVVLMEYGYQGACQSVCCFEEALKLDRSCAEWHFLLGKSLRQLRKLDTFNVIPDKKEQKALEKAVELSPCPLYCTFLAQTYRETAFKIFSLNKDNLSPFKRKSNSMYKKSVEYYKKSIEMAPDSPHINIRCGLGFLTLPKPYRDEDLAKSCIDKALKSVPNNSTARHVEGKYFEQIGDLEAAKRSYKISGEYGAHGAYMDYLQLEFKTNPKYDPLPLLEKLLGLFIEEPYRVRTLCEIGAYYYLIQNNLKKAVTYWLQIIDENHDIARLKTFKPTCMCIKEPFDLLQVAVDEVQLALRKDNTSSEDRNLYERLIFKFKGTELLSNPPEPHRQKILETVDNELRKEEVQPSNSRERQRHGNRGYVNYKDHRDRPSSEREHFQDFAEGYGRKHGSGNYFQKDTKCNWRDRTAVREPSYERQRLDHCSSRNMVSWRERPTSNPEGNDRGDYGGSAQGSRGNNENCSSDRNHADSSTTDNS